jgi:hypothetical protein
MNYFDSGMSKSTNTEVYVDWKTVIYIYVCGQCRLRILVNVIRQPMLKLKIPSGFHDLFLNYNTILMTF